MYFTVLPVLFIIAVSADDQLEECNAFLQPENMRCCSRRNNRPLLEDMSGVPEDMKECMQIPMKPISCAQEECIAKKKGYFSDGKIDRKGFLDVFDKKSDKDPELAALIKENCLSDSADLSKYGMTDMCELLKLKLCIHFQLLKKCTEWRDTDNCQDMKELVQKCSTVL